MMHSLILSLLVVAAPPVAGSPSKWVAEPIVTRQTSFTLPYKIERPQQVSQEPVEVQLHVSTDRGASWRLASRVTPTAGRIPFQSVGDGEFWFVIQTVGRSGQARPEMSAAPILRVLVDTTPPTIRLTANRGQAGQVTVQWEIRDQGLKPESLRIQYRSGGAETWQPVAVSQQNHRVAGDVETGEVTWWPAGASSILQVRAECVDAAGNPGVSHAQVTLAGGAVPAPQVTASIPKAEPPAAPATAPAPAASIPPAATSAPAGAQGAFPTSATGSHGIPDAAAPSVVPASLNAAAPATPAAAPATPPSISTTVPAPAAAPPAAPAATMAAPSAPIAASPAPVATPAAPVTSPAAPVTPPAAPMGTPGIAPTSPSPNAGPTVSAATPGARPRMVNVREFQLEYDASAVGPAGAGRAELWGTRDGGKSWACYALDDDNRSPVAVKLGEEGLYGFRVVARSGYGPAAAPPRSGEQPQSWLGLDLTPPAARLATVQPVPGRPGQMMIAWDAVDFLLAERPISLFCANGSSGPWTPVAVGLENTGAFAWTAPPGTPDAIFLRLEVRDEAGNVAVVQTPTPVALERESPTARAPDNRPAGATVAPMLYR